METLEFYEKALGCQRLFLDESNEYASGEKTCIDCHKGIAHELPDMEGVEGWQ